MKFLRLILVLAFAFQALGLGEILHAEESHGSEACEAAHGGQADSGEHGDCHWHCGTCAHPSTDLPVVDAALNLPENDAFGPAPLQFLPAPPCASIFHPPA